MKGSLSSTCSLNSENPYATITEAAALSKHPESSYVEMKSPARHQHVTHCCSTAAVVTTTSSSPSSSSAPVKNVYDIGNIQHTLTSVTKYQVYQNPLNHIDHRRLKVVKQNFWWMFLWYFIRNPNILLVTVSLFRKSKFSRILTLLSFFFFFCFFC